MQYALVLMKNKFWPSIFATVASNGVGGGDYGGNDGDVGGVGVGDGRWRHQQFSRVDKAGDK